MTRRHNSSVSKTSPSRSDDNDCSGDGGGNDSNSGVDDDIHEKGMDEFGRVPKGQRAIDAGKRFDDFRKRKRHSAGDDNADDHADNDKGDAGSSSTTKNERRSNKNDKRSDRSSNRNGSSNRESRCHIEDDEQREMKRKDLRRMTFVLFPWFLN